MLSTSLEPLNPSVTLPTRQNRRFAMFVMIVAVVDVRGIKSNELVSDVFEGWVCGLAVSKGVDILVENRKN